MKHILLIIGIVFGALSICNSRSTAYRTPYGSTVSEYNENSCPFRCSEEYRPFCAINKIGESKVFVNDCYMAMENCNQSPQQVFHRSGDSDCSDLNEWISK